MNDIYIDYCLSGENSYENALISSGCIKLALENGGGGGGTLKGFTTVGGL